MDTVNFAILGAGYIADFMARTIREMDCVRPYAVASRDGAKSAAFAEKYGFTKSYGSYREMLEDPAVDLVYVATPHSHHYLHVKLCLEHGKHVLCEKAFTANARQAEEILAMAEERKLLLTEAIWTRYMPFSKTIRELVDGGTVGVPSALIANLGYNVRHNERIVNPALAGGALLDLSVYTLTFAFMTFGDDFSKMTVECMKYPTGVDCIDMITLGYDTGRMASLYTTFIADTNREGIVYGDKGYLVVDNINNPQSAVVYDTHRRIKEAHYAPKQITGYEYQVESAVKAIREGRLECPEMPHVETLRMMRLFDQIREEWGIEFPEVTE